MGGIIHPYYRYRRNPPVQYDVERYDCSTGFWEVYKSFRVEWNMIKGWLRTRPDYTDLTGVKKARREAYNLASNHNWRIVEVKDMGRRYTIWDRGWITL